MNLSYMTMNEFVHSFYCFLFEWDENTEEGTGVGIFLFSKKMPTETKGVDTGAGVHPL
jgi:hypothetical protein